MRLPIRLSREMMPLVDDNEIIEFIQSGTRQAFDRVAAKLLDSQARSGIFSSAWRAERTRGADYGWETVSPVCSTALEERQEPTAGTDLAQAAIRAVWEELQPPVGHPVLLLAESGPGATGALPGIVSDLSAADDLAHPVASGTVDSIAVRSWLAARQRAGRPATIVSQVAIAERLAAFLERRRLIFRLPAGSRLVILGSRGNHHDQDPQFGRSLVALLGLDPREVRHLISFPTLTTPLQVGRDAQGRATPIQPPHWVRYRSVEDILVIIDLATTRLPACQRTDVATAPSGDGTHWWLL